MEGSFDELMSEAMDIVGGDECTTFFFLYQTFTTSDVASNPIFKVDVFFYAILWGVASAVSLPVGSILGMIKDPGKVICSILMAFGAGALLCAVSLELFGEAMHHLNTETKKWLLSRVPYWVVYCSKL